MNQAGPGLATPTPAALPGTVLPAPGGWRNIDFISDLHLRSSHPATFVAWRHYMQETVADAVFILGDLFDVWVGDDVVDGTQHGTSFEPDAKPAFELLCQQVLKSASGRLDIFFMHGNRDFLIGPDFAKRAGMKLLSDPSVLEYGGQRWLLSHGDALCLDDCDYMEFRAKVRSTNWQLDFLCKPLAERQSIGRELRRQSEARKLSGAIYNDIDETTACHWLDTVKACTLIHGHTHQPALHKMASGLQRLVLSDWDTTVNPPRSQILRLTAPYGEHQKDCRIERIEL